MPGLNNYTSYTPSPNCAVTNGLAPSGFLLVSAQTQEQVPRNDEATLTGIIRAVGLPTVLYALQYFTMATINSALPTEYASTASPLQLKYFGDFIDNVFMVGGSLQAAPAAGGNGVLAVNYTQNMAALSQRTAYAA